MKLNLSFYLSFLVSVAQLATSLLGELISRYKLLTLSLLFFTLVSLSFLIQIEKIERTTPINLDFTQPQKLMLNEIQREKLLTSWKQIQQLQPNSALVTQQIENLEFGSLQKAALNDKTP